MIDIDKADTNDMPPISFSKLAVRVRIPFWEWSGCWTLECEVCEHVKVQNLVPGPCQPRSFNVKPQFSVRFGVHSPSRKRGAALETPLSPPSSKIWALLLAGPASSFRRSVLARRYLSCQCAEPELVLFPLFSLLHCERLDCKNGLRLVNSFLVDNPDPQTGPLQSPTTNSQTHHSLTINVIDTPVTANPKIPKCADKRRTD